MQLADGTSAMEVPPDNHGRVTANGPTYLRGKLTLREGESALEDTRMALCRCGASQHKPFCDNSHKKIGFVDAGTLPAAMQRTQARRPLSPLAIRLNAQRPGGLHGPLTPWQRWAHRFRNDVPLPLRRLEQQAVLRRDAKKSAYELGLAGFADDGCRHR
jgi:CDGSH-type Zn-finger protein